MKLKNDNLGEKKCHHHSLHSGATGMAEPLLDCEGIRRYIRVNFNDPDSHLGRGGSKDVFMGVDIRTGDKVAVSKALRELDFASSLNEKKRFQGHLMIVPVLGYCMEGDWKESWRIVSPAYEIGNINRFSRLIRERKDLDEWCTRVNVALGVVDVFIHLHQAGPGHKHPLILCDNTENQFVVGSNMEVALADADFTREVPIGETTTCWRRQKVTAAKGPPEAVWPFGDDVPFNSTMAAKYCHYNEKRDIWLIGTNVLRRILLQPPTPEAKAHRDMIFERCVDPNPVTRPSAAELYPMIQALLTMN
eukprot:TRINITY_DN2320_c1_g1_i2.p1 TRINITY_DN2320_c1_g1~~TRINITY_DN2320_c1_g1_i2.p1  ORF type:complete len:305 (-),score=42.56 TRINITY_DN2320_c1_g1_i2:64-978(-)